MLTDVLLQLLVVSQAACYSLAVCPGGGRLTGSGPAWELLPEFYAALG